MSGTHAVRTLRAATVAAAFAVVGSLLLLACGSSSEGSGGPPSRSSGSVVQVVAAENFWGSIAIQIGGSHARVTSIITNPDTDPHDYEPTAADARTLATAQLVVENGIGYDPWVQRFVDAGTAKPAVLNV